MKGNNMEAWKQFELDCTDHLNRVFGYKAQFIHQGFEDSTVADIKCVTKSGKTFYLEAKQCPAQCNQFVLLPDVATQTFEYSKQNSLPINDYSKKIINHMNNDFEDFKEAGTSGKDIIFDNCEEVFFEESSRQRERTIESTPVTTGRATGVREKRPLAVLSNSENALEYISPDQTVILDPPRAGCDKKLIEKLLEVAPTAIIYLSCNPATQARDVKLLLENYKIKKIVPFNFFPRTPHLENLIILKKLS